ncbi:MAG: helix-turn-helix transcriptional regulator [Alphaproteobacteria bacterium]
MEQHDYLTTREVAALLRVKERKVYELASAGELPCRRLTGKLLFPRAEIESLLGAAVRPPAVPALPAAARPNILVGSHDPLLDWALRESGSGLAAFFDGSLDGIARFARGEGIACGLHVFEPSTDSWNVQHVRAACADQPAVLVEWARRRQGLILTKAAAREILGIPDLRGRRVAMRQSTAGGRILFEHLLSEAGMTVADLSVAPATARTESDIAAAVADGSAEAAFGLEAMARQFRLAYMPLVEERYDLLVDRRAWFESPLQALLAFCRTERFRARSEALGGYDISHLETVHWIGP